jgi:hypothetical protein
LSGQYQGKRNIKLSNNTNKQNVRQWHIWISVILGIPLILVGITTFFIAHQDQLGTKKVYLPSWLAGNSMTSSYKDEKVEIKSVAQVGDTTWLATKYGAFQKKGGLAQPITGTPKDDLRHIFALEDTVYFSGKMGIWKYEQQQSTLVYKGDCWQVASQLNGLVAACKGSELLTSTNGVDWKGEKIKFQIDAKTTQQPMTLANLMMDIHTGKWFLGKSAEWIWIDLLGFATVALGITGFIMWLRRRKNNSNSQ